MSQSVKASIIIVDDANSMRMLLRSILHEDGHNVVAQLNDGHLLIKSIEKLRPNIVCLDYNLPGIDGLALLKQVHQSYPSTAVIMITADNSNQIRVEATRAGASGFITKPFSEAELLKEVNQVALAQRLLTRAKANHVEQTGTAPRGKAVIADDSETMRLLLASILEHENFEVVGLANDGVEAVDLTLLNHPDFVCLDIEMPNVDGLQALSQIREMSPDTKTLIITSCAEKNRVVHAAKIGTHGYILKPYKPEQVVAAVSRLFG